ncbi:MAG: hypothetical protein QOH09_2826, partial [Pseudonocardiales bacterium]|nr:hypothetical protein [Pseudonocardiales bacterium]
DIGGSPARRATSDVASVLECGMTTPGRLVLGASRRALVTPGSGACAADSSRVHRFSKPMWLTKCTQARCASRAGGEEHKVPRAVQPYPLGPLDERCVRNHIGHAK